MLKSHLTLAVKEEIVALKNQIKQLNEVCTRLEQENQILKQNATPETLLLIENRGNPNIASSMFNANSNIINSSQNNDQAMVNTTSVNLANTSNNGNSNTVPLVNTNQLANSVSIESRNIVPVNQDTMISSFTEHVLTNNGEILTNISNNNQTNQLAQIPMN